MIVVMQQGATRAQIDHMVERIEGLGLKSHVIVGTERTVIAAWSTGEIRRALAKSISPFLKSLLVTSGIPPLSL